MVAASLKAEPRPSYIPPPVAEPAPKSQNALQVELIALPLIAIVAAFMLFSVKSAILITAVVTLGAIVYLYGGETAEVKPAAPEQTPKPSCPNAPSVVASAPLYKPKPVRLDLSSPPYEKGDLGSITFGSMEDAKAFEKACTHHFQERLAYDYFSIDEPCTLYFTCKSNNDLEQRAEELRDFIGPV